jgi:hypothetical protein
MIKLLAIDLYMSVSLVTVIVNRRQLTQSGYAEVCFFCTADGHYWQSVLDVDLTRGQFTKLVCHGMRVLRHWSIIVKGGWALIALVASLLTLSAYVS